MKKKEFEMNFLRITFICLIFMSSVYSKERMNFDITLEGFDDVNLGASLNFPKEQFQIKFKLGLDYTRNKYKDAFTTNTLKTSVGVHFGILTYPTESIELIPALGFNFHARLGKTKGIDESYNSFKLGPNTNFTIYKLFNSFIIGVSLNLALITFEWVEEGNWNRTLEIYFKPHFIIGFRF